MRTLQLQYFTVPGKEVVVDNEICHHQSLDQVRSHQKSGQVNGRNLKLKLRRERRKGKIPGRIQIEDQKKICRIQQEREFQCWIHQL
jgi:hypothetical protein